MSKGQASPSLLRKIFERDNGVCVYCGNLAQEVDHVIPIRDGGKTISSNLVCACRSCNRRKKNHFGDPVWLTRAIFQLLQQEEDTSWMDSFYT